MGEEFFDWNKVPYPYYWADVFNTEGIPAEEDVPPTTQVGVYYFTILKEDCRCHRVRVVAHLGKEDRVELESGLTILVDRRLIFNTLEDVVDHIFGKEKE